MFVYMHTYKCVGKSIINDLMFYQSLGDKSRKLANWVKMKPEYGDITRDLDVVIVGGALTESKGMSSTVFYVFGWSLGGIVCKSFVVNLVNIIIIKGFRGKGLSTFTCAVKVTDLNGLTIYQPVCRVGTGYSFDELKELREKLEPIKIPWETSFTGGKGPNGVRNQPMMAYWKPKPVDKPDFFIPPKESFVLQIKCAELVYSTSFPAGITARFPRVERIRYDKPVDDIMTLEELKEIKNNVRDTTHQAKERTDGATYKKVKVPKKEVIRSDGSFSVKMDTSNEEGIFSGDFFTVVGTGFTTYDSISKEKVKMYTRDDVILMIQKQGKDVMITYKYIYILQVYEYMYITL
jgi:hypothetical protein